MVWGINMGQWPAAAAEIMISQGRRPATFNIIGKKVESNVSHFMSNPFNIGLFPTSGKMDSLVEKAKKIYYSDKSLMSWKTSQRIALRDFFTMIGFERLYINDRYNEFGNIDFEPLNFGHVYMSPSWKSADVWELKDYFEWNEMYLPEIVDAYPRSEGRLKEVKEREEREGVNLGEYSGGPQIYRSTEQKWGDKHKVITFHHTKKEDMMWEYDLRNDCNFPETGFKNGTDDDHRVKWEYIQRMGLDPNFDVTMVKRRHVTKYVEAFCPTLVSDMFLVSGKDKVQVGGVNLFPLGNGFNGQYKNVADDLYDIQISFNKSRMTIDDIKQSSAKGACLIDKRLAGGRPEMERQIEENWNVPGARMWVDENSTTELGPNGGVIPLPRIQPTGDTYQDDNTLLSLSDWFSSIPAAMDSRTESTTESGKLYQSKVQVALVGMKWGMEIWEEHEKAKTIAFMRQIKITYAGLTRRFSSPGGAPFYINRPVVEVGPDGVEKKRMVDDISLLPEMAVVLNPSPDGMTIKNEMQLQYQNQMQYLQGNPNMELAMLVVLDSLFQTYPGSDEKKEEIGKAFEMLKTNAALEQVARNMKIKSSLAPAPQIPGAAQPPQSGPPVQDKQPPTNISDSQIQPESAKVGTPQQEVVV